MAKFRSEVDSLPLGWSTRGRRNTFASYHCCTLIHKRAQYLGFLSSALLALINRPPLRLTLAWEASDDPRTTMPIISDRSPAIGPFHLRQGCCLGPIARVIRVNQQRWASLHTTSINTLAPITGRA